MHTRVQKPKHLLTALVISDLQEKCLNSKEERVRRQCKDSFSVGELYRAELHDSIRLRVLLECHNAFDVMFLFINSSP